MKLKKGDTVMVIAGKYKSTADHQYKGEIKDVLRDRNRVVIEGINIVKRHRKARGMGQKGGVVEMEAPINASNVMLVCPRCGRATRIGYRFLEGGDKVRFCKACDEVVDKK